MDAFWKWLMKANARGVLAGAIIGLLLVTAWWTWKELAPSRAGSGAAAARPAPPEWETLGLADYIQRQLAEGSGCPSNNPFVDWRAVADARQPPPQIVVPVPHAPPRPPDRNPGYPQPPQPPRQKPTVTLEFRGLLRSSSGQVLALIRDSLSDHAAFYRVGQDVCGYAVRAVGMEEAAIGLPDGGTATLKIKTPVTLDVPEQP